MNRFALLAVAGTFAGFMAVGCSSTDSPNTTQSTIAGGSAKLDGGTASTSMVVDNNNKPVSVSVNLSDSLLASIASDTTPRMLLLTLPSQKSATPFDHVELDWNPHGHPPPGVYDLPHFDFHFYTVDTMTQMMVQGGPDAVAVDSMLLPTGYTAGPPPHIAVPMMGVHYSPATDFVPGNIFHQTLIYGFYQGHMYFIEPMITLATLNSTTATSTFDIPQPRTYAYTGKYFPSQYTISYDAAAKMHSVTLTGFAVR